MPDWVVGASRELPISDTEDWDGAAAKASVFAWAGWPDDPDPGKAKRAFLVYDRSNADQKGAYKLPFARVSDGKLVAVPNGVRNAASRLPQTDIPDAVKERAQAVIDAYMEKISPDEEESKSRSRAADSQRAKPREQRLVDVRGAGGTTRRIETRRSPQPMMVRADGEEPGFEGYASTFWLVDAFGTAIAPGAFTKTLQERAKDILVLWQHNPDWPIGVSLAAAQDGTGLKVQARISDTSLGRDALTLLRDGVPLGLSIGFRTIRERQATPEDPLRFGFNTPEWVRRDPGTAWVIQEIALWEYSPVTFEANDEAAPTVIHSESPDVLVVSQTLEDMRAGRLDAGSRALIAQLVAAYESAAPEGSAPPRTEEEARRDREAALRMLAAARGLTLEQATCVA